MTFWREGTDQLTSAAEIRKAWDENSEKLAEPFRSALLSLPYDALIWCERLSQWPTVAWDNKQGSVTLAGDAAHPMTYRKQHTYTIIKNSLVFLHQLLYIKLTQTPSPNRSRPRSQQRRPRRRLPLPRSQRTLREWQTPHGRSGIV